MCFCIHTSPRASPSRVSPMGIMGFVFHHAKKRESVPHSKPDTQDLHSRLPERRLHTCTTRRTHSPRRSRSQRIARPCSSPNRGHHFTGPFLAKPRCSTSRLGRCAHSSQDSPCEECCPLRHESKMGNVSKQIKTFVIPNVCESRWGIQRASQARRRRVLVAFAR